LNIRPTRLFILLVTILFTGTVPFIGHAQVTPESLAEDAYYQRLGPIIKGEKFQHITLTEALEQGLRTNYGQLIRNHENKLLELSWEDTYEDFWYPKLSLNLSTTQQKIARIRSGTKNGNINPRLPLGTLALTIDEYTIFNWGKDYLDYLNSKEAFRRNKNIKVEERRDLRHDIIISYFKMFKAHQVLKVKKSYLRHASYIYRLDKERVEVKKIKLENYLKSRALYLKAQSQYQEALNDVLLQDRRLSLQIADIPGVRYVIRDKLEYQILQTTVEELHRLGQKHNGLLKNTEVLIKNSERSYELALKNNLPLPKFTMNLGAYTYSFGNGVSNQNYATGSGDDNLDLVASINASWSLTGSGGVLNHRTTTQALIQKHLAYRKHGQAKLILNTQLMQILSNIKSLEKRVTILQARTSNLQKAFDNILENYINKKTSFESFSLILDDLQLSKAEYQNVIFKHLQQKVLLTKLVGITDLPGKNFELLAKKE
jgi:outer membrane protein TolC